MLHISSSLSMPCLYSVKSITILCITDIIRTTSILALFLLRLKSDCTPTRTYYIDWEKMIDLSHLDYEFYRYNPSLAGAAIFIVLFSITTTVHAYLTWRYKAKFFLAFVAGGLCTSANIAFAHS